MILGQAEGGMKVTLFRVNEIDKNNLSVAQLNEYYFKTMHHEFTHILNQKKAYDTSYDRISESDYVGSSWYRVSESVALQKGFISPYAMDRATEDFAEMVAIYVTNDASTWEDMLASAGTTGRPIIEKKFEIVFDYMLNSWGLDLDKLREIVLRRQSEITELDLSTL
jgi:substrate import-associated zinc metallohydrolase lipoprotein